METGETVDRKTRVPAREQQRVVLSGTDQRITSGPAAIMAAFKGRIHGCTRTLRRYVRFLLHRGRRPYMAEQTHRDSPRGRPIDFTKQSHRENMSKYNDMF